MDPKTKTWLGWVGTSATTVTDSIWTISTSGTSVASTTWNMWNEKTRHILNQSLVREYSRTVSTATISTTAWISWNAGWLAASEIRDGYVRVIPAPVEVPAVREAREALERQYHTERKARDDEYAKEIRIAKEKAERLLLSVLDPMQKEELKTKGFFHCKSKTGNRYRIHRGIAGNVRRVDSTDKEIEKLCAHPQGVPEGDAMVAQLFHIENDEEGFRQTANITRLTN